MKNKNKLLKSLVSLFLVALMFALPVGATGNIVTEGNNLFNHGLIKFSNDGNKWGFLNEKGEVQIEPIYDLVEDFSDGLAAVEVEHNKWGYIDTEGNVVIEPQFYSASDFVAGRACVWKEDGDNIKEVFIDKEGNELLETVENYNLRYLPNFYFTRNKYWKWTCYDYQGNKIGDTLYCNIKDYKEDMIGVRIKTNKGKFWGYMNENAELVVPCEYEDIKYYNEGFAAVKKDGKWGFVDKEGNIVIKIKYDKVRNFSQGLAAVKKGKKWGFVNKKGKVIVKPKYSRANSFSEGLASVKHKGKWGYINKKGKFAIKPKFKKNYGSFSSGVAGISIKKSDKKVVHQFINKKGKIVLKTDKYLEVGDFIHGKALVTYYSDSILRNYNFINIKGEEIIDRQLDDAVPYFDDNYTIAMFVGSYTILDENCNPIFAGAMWVDDDYYAGGGDWEG